MINETFDGLKESLVTNLTKGEENVENLLMIFDEKREFLGSDTYNKIATELEAIIENLKQVGKKTDEIYKKSNK